MNEIQKYIRITTSDDFRLFKTDGNELSDALPSFSFPSGSGVRQKIKRCQKVKNINLIA